MKHKLYGDRLEEKRNDCNFTQDDIGKALGVDKKTVSAWERGIIMPRMSKFIRLCEILDISPAYLLGFTDIEINASHSNYLIFPEDCTAETIQQTYDFLQFKRSNQEK